MYMYYKIARINYIFWQGKGSMTTYWLESLKSIESPYVSVITHTDRPVTPGNISVNHVSLHGKEDTTSLMSEGSVTDRKLTYISFMRMKHDLPKAADIGDISDEMLDLFNNSSDEKLWYFVLNMLNAIELVFNFTLSLA